MKGCSTSGKNRVKLDLVLENAENVLLTFLQTKEVSNESVLRVASNYHSNICWYKKIFLQPELMNCCNAVLANSYKKRNLLEFRKLI